MRDRIIVSSVPPGIHWEDNAREINMRLQTFRKKSFSSKLLDWRQVDEDVVNYVEGREVRGYFEHLLWLARRGIDNMKVTTEKTCQSSDRWNQENLAGVVENPGADESGFVKEVRQFWRCSGVSSCVNFCLEIHFTAN